MFRWPLELFGSNHSPARATKPLSYLAVSGVNCIVLSRPNPKVG